MKKKSLMIVDIFLELISKHNNTARTCFELKKKKTVK